MWVVDTQRVGLDGGDLSQVCLDGIASMATTKGNTSTTVFVCKFIIFFFGIIYPNAAQLLNILLLGHLFS